MAYDIFISYCHDDKSIADAACAVLESEGLRCWIAPRDILPGSEWTESIIDGIAGAKAMVLIFSRRADQSPQVRREVERAIHHALPVVPVRIEDVMPGKAMEYLISTPHWMDALTPPLEAHYRQLATSLKMLIQQQQLAPASTELAAARATSAPPLRKNFSTSKIAAGIVALLLCGAIFLGGWQIIRRSTGAQTTATPPHPTQPSLVASPVPPAPSSLVHELVGGHWLAPGVVNGARITVDSEFRADGTLAWSVHDVAGNLLAHGIGKYTIDEAGHYTFTGDFNDEAQITWIDEDHFTFKYLKSTNPAAVIGLEVLNSREN